MHDRPSRKPFHVNQSAAFRRVVDLAAWDRSLHRAASTGSPTQAYANALHDAWLTELMRNNLHLWEGSRRGHVQIGILIEPFADTICAIAAMRRTLARPFIANGFQLFLDAMFRHYQHAQVVMVEAHVGSIIDQVDPLAGERTGGRYIFRRG